MAKTKSFCVAVEGATTDGRVIERAWLTEMAATYNRATYGARINMEHIRGITADKPFKAYGDVLALSTAEVPITLAGKTQNKLGLFAELDVTDELVAINRDRQKLYTSVEISPNFANSGKAYLVGLAVTDSPASLGTELLAFAAANPEANPLASRKQDKANLFSAGHETAFELAETGPANDGGDVNGLVKLATDFFRNFGKAKEELTPPPPPPTPANDNVQLGQLVEGIGKFGAAIEAISASVTRLSADIAGVRTDHDTLKASIETTDGNPERRPPASGLKTYAATDC